MSPVPPPLSARYTAVLSDLHLSDAEPADPRRPGWREFKRAGLDNDARLTAVLDHLRVLSGGEPVDLVLDGDALDFDTILALPDPAPFPVTWLERQRGLDSEEAKSLWKLGRILEFHPVFVTALRRWVHQGNGLTFIIGNHDLGRALPPPRCGIDLVGHSLWRDPFYFVHDPAHADPDRLSIVGHLHPLAALAGPPPRTWRAPCFWWQAERSCLVLPAFGSFTAGAVIQPDAADTLHVICDETVSPVPALCCRAAPPRRLRSKAPPPAPPPGNRAP